MHIKLPVASDAPTHSQPRSLRNYTDPSASSYLHFRPAPTSLLSIKTRHLPREIFAVPPTMPQRPFNRSERKCCTILSEIFLDTEVIPFLCQSIAIALLSSQTPLSEFKCLFWDEFYPTLI